ncbi:Innexin inx2 [Orchesella cincta]|uniref:Innexin n=1 Tax=Orchesella cincta TaxID=48709 RepID=A0A1D2NJ51_ORCCI|nr:Innexin inx2 [Orchesella cincta]
MLNGELFDPFKQVMNHLTVKPDPVVTDNWIFFLHRKWSFIVVLASLIFIACRPVLLESPIACLGPEEETIPKDFLEYYCWLHGTYIVPEYINARIGIDIPFPGIGPDLPSTTRVYQLHYLYYPFIILLQFFLFRASKYLWKYLEGERLRHLLSELTTAIIDDATLKKRLFMVADYMTSFTTFHTTYAYRYLLCELFNIASLILQIYLINSILHGEFLGFGITGMRYITSLSTPTGNPPQKVEDPFTKLFPKVTMCKVEVSSPGGNLIIHEALCVMPLNNVAEKIFLFMWFWLLFIGVVSGAGAIYRVAVVSSKKVRYGLLRLKVRKSLCPPKKLEYLVDNFSYGDWFVFSLIQKNTDPWVFARLVDELVDKMEELKGKDE